MAHSARHKFKRQADFDAYVERQKEARRRWRAELRRDVLDGYGGTCACCGTEYEPHLVIDHVEGGGTAERRERGSALHAFLRDTGYPSGYQVLCHNCNWAKHRDGRCGCSDGSH